MMTLIQQIRERAAWRRLALLVFTQHPVADLAPPAVAELAAPGWIEDDREERAP